MHTGKIIWRVTIAVAVIALPSCGACFGQEGPAAFSRQDYKFGRAQALIATDLNFDGLPDIAGAGGGLDILYGQEGGTFTKKRSYPGGGASCLVSADWNADGRTDVALLNNSGIKVMCVDEKGKLRRVKGPATKSLFGGLACGDFNQDGVLDLAAGQEIFDVWKRSSVWHFVCLFDGVGDGTFANRRHVTIGAHGLMGKAAWTVRTADFNGDGLADVACENRIGTNSISIFYGLGGGNFADKVDYAVPEPPRTYNCFTCADLNSDGLTDVAMTCANDTLAILYGRLGGGFEEAQSYAVAKLASPVIAGDFNGDGRMDLAMGGGEKPAFVSILYGQEGGGFAEQRDHTVGRDVRYDAVLSLAAADFDGDGRLDIASGNYYSRTVTVLLNTGNEP